MIETQLAEIAPAIPTENAGRIPGQPENSPTKHAGWNSNDRRESFSKRSINIFFEPPPKVIGSYLKIYIYKNFENIQKIHFQLGNKIK